MSLIHARFPDLASHVRQIFRLREGINAIDPDRATPEDRVRLLHMEADEEWAFGRLDDLMQAELDAAAGLPPA